MNASQEQLLHLLTLMIHGGEPNSGLFSKVNENELFEIALRQNVSSLLHPIIEAYSAELNLDEQIKRDWKKSTILIAVQQLRITSQLDPILNLFKENNVSTISLKGLVFKQLYSQPELRTMSDLDLLISVEDIPKSIELLKRLGYDVPDNFNVNDPGHMHIEMYKPGSLPVELHKTLWNPRYMKKRDNQQWTNQLWKNKRLTEVGGIQFTALALDDELINSVIHMATHLIYSGIKLRHLCDFALFLKTYRDKFDFEYINSTLKSMDLFSFFNYLLLTCNSYLALEVPIAIIQKNQCKLLINDIFATNSVAEAEGWLELSGRYPFYRNNRLLFPLAFLIEVCRQLIKKRKSMFISISYSKRSFKAFSTRTHLLRIIGLHVRINKF
ncbi:nucleotidyltransferase domain-containing protein [Desulfosporosinus meridiei]|uniref:Nucleotidyltransferase family protein n=1 Tax=Desulfosporosinus meridiei (strain ATCC BAA-275 / DSM 13257 / KCTC 12902 / NCIMB 13706 / S10) TaxID=768704 RepID=J7IW49_DESMD|nr:nucleotidyltransferase family protein [Desulfosporosinus meridiei]AFQ45970.1 hypothetical protein Desmer_4141 [Desulfosporosinus meridiei DSM 13257]